MGSNNSNSKKQIIGLWLGQILSIAVLLFANLDPENSAVTKMAAVALLMAVWWITEAIPIPATALIPVAIFPLLGIMTGKAVASTYFNNVIFLFIGGFIMALALQRWNLHRRIALKIIMLIGASPRRIILGFMVATALLSMWISNTATTMMMVPIALAIILKFREWNQSAELNKFSVGLLISIAYSASIGGLATLIGTPPNLSFSRIFAIYFPNAPEISFTTWFAFGLPLTIIFLIIAWLLLSFMFARKRIELPKPKLFKEEYSKLGKTSYEEKVVLGLFLLLAALWLFRKDIILGSFTMPGWSSIWPMPGFIDDGTVAIVIALLLFIIPSRTTKGRLMNWETASKLHWGIVILFGGGFALAAGFKASGLSVWVAQHLIGLGDITPVFITVCICTMITFLTELTSNTATSEMILPLLGSLAVAIKTNPLLLMIPATLSASCAFMLPVATPPNAIVFGTGEVKMWDMIKAGIIMNITGVILITALIYLIGTAVFNIDLNIFLEWANTP